jgi:hypothetical protein
MDDFDKIEATRDEVVVSNTPARYFCAWIEDWEEEGIKKEDPVNETHLLAKGPDNGYVQLIAGKDIIHWTKPKKKNGWWLRYFGI